MGSELVVADKGPKMKSTGPDRKGSGMNTSSKLLKAQNVTMALFARDLSDNQDIGKLVVDKTGLSGGFDFELAWSPDRGASNQTGSAEDAPGFFTAIQEQLGRKLKPSKLTVQAIVIERAERPSEN